MKTLMLVLVLCVSLVGKDKPPRDWKVGTLVDVTMEKRTRVVGSTHGHNGDIHGSVGERRDDSTYYHIDAGDLIYVAKRTLTSRRDKQVNVTVNTQVKYAIVGSDFFLLDEDGKEHKMSIEEKIAKPKTKPEGNDNR